MKEKIILLLLAVIGVILCKAQTNTVKVNPISKYIEFREKNADSAFFYLQQMKQKPYDADNAEKFIHNQFSDVFRQIAEANPNKEELSVGFKLLDLLEQSGDPFFQKNATIISLWVNALQQNTNAAFIKNIITEKLNPALATQTLFKNRLGRYAFLIYQLATKHAELNAIANNLLQTVYVKLENEQPKINTDSALRKDFEFRGFYRYHYAYANWLFANNEISNANKTEAYLKKAFDYSPDYFDRAYADGYFYDMFFYFKKGKKSFADDYLNYLTGSNKSRETILSILLEIALKDPQYKAKLKSFYASDEAFNNYWLSAVNKNSSVAPQLNLQLISGENFSAETYKDKWVVIDFWGTWCAPCRKEHPKVEKFYQSLISKQSQDIILLTVACRDEINLVKNYMAQYKYSFPVAMADNKIENLFKIKGYPTKVLITPQGKYFALNNDVNMADFIEKFIH